MNWRVVVVVVLAFLAICASGTLAQGTPKEMDKRTPEQLAFTKRIYELSQKRKANGEPPLTISEIVEMMGPEDQARLVEADVRGEGNFLRFKARWKYIKTPDMAIRYTMDEMEPFSAEAIEVLERMLPQAKDPEQALSIAALLYRHKRQAGEVFLREHAGRMRDAAIILAMNREPVDKVPLEMLQPIDSRGVYLLGQMVTWQVGELFDRGIATENELQFDHIAALCWFDGQLEPRTIKRVSQEFETTSHRLTKILSAGALLKHAKGTGDSEALRMITLILRGQGPPETQFQDQLMASFAAMGLQDERLKAAVQDFVSSQLKRDNVGWVTDSRVLSSVVALGRRATDRDIDLIAQVITKNDVANSIEPALDAALYQLRRQKDPAVQALLEKILPPEEWARVVGLAELRELPIDYTPFESRSYLYGLSLGGK
jgi:hypothetical protein